MPRILSPMTGVPKSQFTGAIILDCVLGYDESKDSQDMEDDWFDLVPEAFGSILSHSSNIAA